MEKIHSRDIRNVCLLGHGASGKTSLAEAMLYIKKETDRLGKPSEGNTVCDYDAEEIKRGFTLSSSIAPVMHNGAKINIIDTPGYLDFQGEALQALRVAGSALIVVDGKAGVEVGTEIAWDLVCKDKMPRAFFINKCDDPETRFRKVFLEMHEKFGNSICPVVIPLLEGDDIVGLLDLIDMRAVAFAHGRDGQPIEIPAGNEERIERCLSMLHEAVASTSEELMDKFFDQGSLTEDEMRKFWFQQGDSEGFVNYPLSIKKVKMSAMFSEQQGGFIRVSLRSHGKVDVNTFARRYFNGGGHHNAAGGKSFMNMEDTIAHYIKAVEEYHNEGLV